MKLVQLFLFQGIFLSISISAALAQRGETIDSVYLAGIKVKTLKSQKFEEISGMAFSRIHPNLIYTHTDSGGEPTVYLLDSMGKELGEIKLEKAKNRDWEDIAVGPGPGGKSYVYVGEIGDNEGNHSEVCIYRFEEPSKIEEEQKVKPDILRLTFPDGARDAETLMIDPVTGDLFMVSKREEKNRLYRIPHDAFSLGKIQLEELQHFNFSGSVAGDISGDGSKILIKNYFAIYYWERKSGETIPEALRRNPKRLPYVPEPQGEAVCFNPNGSSYFTLSERRYKISPTLYRYPKK
jgi:Tol biopolymer transport system component